MSRFEDVAILATIVAFFALMATLNDSVRPAAIVIGVLAVATLLADYLIRR